MIFMLKLIIILNKKMAKSKNKHSKVSQHLKNESRFKNTNEKLEEFYGISKEKHNSHNLKTHHSRHKKNKKSRF